jgi:hypothetical protein
MQFLLMQGSHSIRWLGRRYSVGGSHASTCATARWAFRLTLTAVANTVWGKGLLASSRWLLCRGTCSSQCFAGPGSFHKQVTSQQQQTVTLLLNNKPQPCGGAAVHGFQQPIT